MKSANFAVFLLMMFSSLAFCDPVTYTSNFRFLDLPIEFNEFQFEISGNRVTWNEGKNETQLSEADIKALKGFSGQGTYILGTPVAILEYKSLDANFDHNRIKGIYACAPFNNSVAVACSNNVKSGDDYKTAVDIHLIQSDSILNLIHFEIKENIYNEHVSSSAQISPDILAVTTSSSRHPFINTLYIIDVPNKKILGAVGFGRIRYLSSQKSFRITQQVPNCKNLEEVLLYNELHPSFLSVENGKTSSPEWQSCLDNIVIMGK